MTSLPGSLLPVEPLARAVFETGWRPAYTEGPTVGELIELIGATLAAAA